MARRSFKRRYDRRKSRSSIRRTLRKRPKRRRSSRRKTGSRSGGGPGGFSIKSKPQMIREKTICCNNLIDSTKDPNAKLEGDCKNWFGAMTQGECKARKNCIARGSLFC